jgi:DNA-binding beta-propeller fold protein YncE
MAPHRTTGRGRVPTGLGRPVALVGLTALVLSGCGVFATPNPAPVGDASLAPAGSMGYVACPDEVTPVELATHTAEPGIPLPLSGTPALGDYALATSPDGRWAYLVTSDGEVSSSAASTGAVAGHGAVPAGHGSPAVPPAGVGVQNVVVPINLVTQQAGAPIRIPGQGGTHAIVVLPGGRTVLAASGSTIVPVDTATRRVGTPLDLGPGRTVFGMVLEPGHPVLYALVQGGVYAVDTTHETAGAEIPTGLSVSSVYSPHGIAITATGATVYVVGQGGADFGGRVLPIDTATGTAGTAAGFDSYGIADPAALAVTPDGSSVLVVDSANNWVNPVPLATFADPPPPVHLPPSTSGSPSTGTQHPTDIVAGPGAEGAFIVDGFSTVIPYQPVTHSFGRPIPVCTGASSMSVAPAP